MSRRSWLLSFLIYALVLLALITRNGQIMLLALPLGIYLAAAIFFAPEETRLRVTRELSLDHAPQGKPVTVRLTVFNDGPSLEELYLSDRRSPALELIQGQTGKALMLPHGQAVQIEYTLRGKRGRYGFPGIQVLASDFSGLFQMQSFLPAPGELLIFPTAVKLKRIPIRPGQTRGFSGPIPTRQGGTGMDFYGVREYQLGDPVRHVNWRISARQEEDLFTNEFEQERIADVGLILDARQEMDIAVKGNRLFDYSILAAASLAQTFLSDGHRVSLFIYGFSLDRVVPGYGKIQQERILRTLARAETVFSYALETLSHLPTRLFPAKSQLVLVSPLGQDDLGPLYRLRALGYEVLIVSPNPVDFERNKLDPQPAYEPAAMLAGIERALLIHKLRRAGIQVVDWNIDIPLERAIASAFGGRPINRRNIRLLP